MSFSLWGLPGTLAMLVAWAAALIIFRTSPDRKVNRRLAFLLLVEGIWVGGAMGVLFFLESAEAVRIAALASTAASVAVPFLYLAFLGTALSTWLVVPLRSKHVLRLITLVGAASVVSVFLFPQLFVSEPYSPGWAPWNFRHVELGQRFNQLQGMVYLYGFLAAVAACRESHCCQSLKRQAFWFAVAFGGRDVYLGVTLLLYPVVRPVAFWGDVLYNPMEGLVYLVYVLLLSYGVLQAQLFDIHIRLRVAIRRSTFVAMTAGAFFLASELLEEFVPVDDKLLGLVAAGVIVLCMRQLQQLAERVVTRFMPRPAPTADELEARKLDVYRAALEGALQDGVVTEREEEILLRLRSKLQISENEAARVHKELAYRDG